MSNRKSDVADDDAEAVCAKVAVSSGVLGNRSTGHRDAVTSDTNTLDGIDFRSDVGEGRSDG